MESEVRSPESSIRDTNFMQKDLIVRSGRNPLEWIREMSDKFRRLVNLRPEFFFGYADLSEEEKTRRLELVEAELNQLLKEATQLTISTYSAAP